VRFGFHNFRHALATALVKNASGYEDGAGDIASRGLRTTMQLYAQSDMESIQTGAN
jgi:hypothetical protein